METTAEPGLPGTVLDGRYRVGALLARGGMSFVYRGEDLRLGRPVAIKVMKPEYVGDASFLARFEREARSAATLNHPGVVSVYDHGRDGEHVFLVMELVDGGTLRDLIRSSGPLPVALTLTILEHVLSALGAAHAAGLVHRDVKPENVLISSKGEVKVADFGLVRAVSSMTMATGDVILGTVAYLSPEQVSTGYSDERSDVYAAGIVAYEMFTGHPPFAGENAISVAYQHVHSDVPAPSEQAPSVPHAIDELILEATSRDADQRPENARAFLAESVALRAELGIRRVPVPTPEQEVRTADRDTVQARSDGPSGTRAVAPQYPTMVGHPTTVQRPGAAVPGSAPAAPVTGRTPKPPRTPPTPAQRRRRIRLIAVILVVLLGIGAAVGGWWLGSGRWTSLPVVVGSQAEDADQAVRLADLVPVRSTALNDEVPAGQIVSADPAEGSRQLRDSTVALVVSGGRPKVPSINPGSDRLSAAGALRAVQLNPVTDQGSDVYNNDLTAGTVVTTRPPAGTSLKINSPVTLVLSKGPAPLEIPEVTDKSEEDAGNKLIAAGFTVGEPQLRFDPTQRAGTVIGTSPPAGAAVPGGSTVSLVLSNALTVPYVFNRSAAEARTLLTEAGFSVVVDPAEFNSAVDNGSVISSDPASGTLMDPSAAQVHLTLSNAVTVADWSGWTIDAARAGLEAQGLLVDTNTPWFFGNVVRSQDPPAGTRVAPQSRVLISTSG